MAARHRARLPARRGRGRWRTRRSARSRAARTSAWTAFEQRDDVGFLKHSLAYYAGDDAPRIDYRPVRITSSPPGTRAYGAARRAMPRPNGPRRPAVAESATTSDRRAALPARTGGRARVAALRRAVHRRHVGAAGPAVHRDELDGTLELPLVVPHGDLRQLRRDGQRQAGLGCQTFLRDLHARAGAGRGRSRTSRSSATSWSRSTASSTSSRASKPYIIPKGAAHARRGEYLQTPAQLDDVRAVQLVHQLHAVLRGLPAVRARPQFHRPGVLALLHRYNADSRDGGRGAADGDPGLGGRRLELHRGRLLLEVCPKGVDPPTR